MKGSTATPRIFISVCIRERRGRASCKRQRGTSCYEQRGQEEKRARRPDENHRGQRRTRNRASETQAQRESESRPRKGGQIYSSPRGAGSTPSPGCRGNHHHDDNDGGGHRSNTDQHNGPRAGSSLTAEGGKSERHHLDCQGQQSSAQDMGRQRSSRSGRRKVSTDRSADATDDIGRRPSRTLFRMDEEKKGKNTARCRGRAANIRVHLATSASQDERGNRRNPRDGRQGYHPHKGTTRQSHPTDQPLPVDFTTRRKIHEGSQRRLGDIVESQHRAEGDDDRYPRRSRRDAGTTPIPKTRAIRRPLARQSARQHDEIHRQATREGPTREGALIQGHDAARASKQTRKRDSRK